MKAIVDTNVVAYLLLGTEAFVEESRACFETISSPLALSTAPRVTGALDAKRESC